MTPAPLVCATCGAELERVDVDHGVMWACRHCGGRAAGIGLLRRSVARDYANELWIAGIAADKRGSHRCPSCQTPMIQAPARVLNLDICKGCQLVWFDPGEFDAAQVTTLKPKVPLSQEDLEVLARKQARGIAAEYQVHYGDKMPLNEALLLVPGVMGLPLEDDSETASIPWATWAIAALVLIASTFAFFSSDLLETFGLVPREAARYGGMTFVTAFFIHSGVFQMIVNLYFLGVFGDNVENFLGHATFVMLVAVGALAGEGAHVLLSNDRAVPFAGATAGVAAIVLFYGLKFPQAKLRYFRVFRWYTMPAGAAVGLWLVANLFGGAEQLMGTGETSSWVYLGGGAVGFVFWLALRNDVQLATRARSGS